MVMALRIQLERMHAGFFPSLREYAKAVRHQPLSVFLRVRGRCDRHAPGSDEPRRGDHRRRRRRRMRSVILEQVTNGVAVRMAVLYLLAGEPIDVKKLLLKNGRVVDPASGT